MRGKRDVVLLSDFSAGPCRVVYAAVLHECGPLIALLDILLPASTSFG